MERRRKTFIEEINLVRHTELNVGRKFSDNIEKASCPAYDFSFSREENLIFIKEIDLGKIKVKSCCGHHKSYRGLSELIVRVFDKRLEGVYSENFRVI